MYRFALRPLWIVSHVFVAFLVVLCANLGFWQLRRHDERAERNAQVIARSEAPVVDVQTLVAEFDDVEFARYRPASVEGEYLRDADLLIDNRSYDGLPGAWVVTPLRTTDGRTVAVSRGFLGFDEGELVPPPAPAGMVTVTGTALPWVDGCGVRTTDDGTPIGALRVRFRWLSPRSPEGTPGSVSNGRDALAPDPDALASPWGPQRRCPLGLGLGCGPTAELLDADP